MIPLSWVQIYVISILKFSYVYDGLIDRFTFLACNSKLSSFSLGSIPQLVPYMLFMLISVYSLQFSSLGYFQPWSAITFIA